MAQKLVFDKLKTKQSELQITFDGISYESYNVNSLKSNGLEIPDTCDNFDNIKIKDKDDNEIDEFYYLLKDFSNSFYRNSKVKRIKISNNITSIGNYAFNNCSNLTSITIPNSVTSIGDGAFSSCSGLTSITIPDSVTSIGSSAFYNCYNLTSITIPNSVTSIRMQTFSYCSNLTSITIPDSVTSIEYQAFYVCSSLTSIEIPESVTSIEGSAFNYCSSLTDIEIDENNQYFTVENQILFNKNKSTLIYYFNPSSTYEIPNFVTSIGKSAFFNYSSLISITIPETVTSIGDRAFYKCSSLTSITIPNFVTEIGRDAFFNCSNLTSIIIPESVTYLGDSFLAYANDISIKYRGTEEQWASLIAKNRYWNIYLSNYSIVYNYDENDETATVDITITLPDEP